MRCAAALHRTIVGNIQPHYQRCQQNALEGAIYPLVLKIGATCKIAKNGLEMRLRVFYMVKCILRHTTPGVYREWGPLFLLAGGPQKN